MVRKKRQIPGRERNDELLVVIEVSKSLGLVHVSELDKAMKLNRFKTLMGKDNDWNIVDTAKSDVEALNKAAFWRGVLRIQKEEAHE